MRTPISAQYALSVCAVIALAAGCNSGPAVSPAPLAPQQRTSADRVRTPANSCRVDACIYVMNANGSSVTVYAAGANGNVFPIRTISGPKTMMIYPSGIARGADHDTYVTNFNYGSRLGFVTVYAPSANGNAAPIRTISGSNTQLTYPNGPELDASGELYVADRIGAVEVYANGANGNVAPIRRIAGGNTRLDIPFDVAVDGAGELYVANSRFCPRGHCSGADLVTVYAAGANGNATPIRTISGSNTGLNLSGSIALDALGEINVANLGGQSVTVYAKGANGNVAPIRTIAGSMTGFSGPVSVALDAGGRIYVGSVGAPARVTVYAAGANGNAAPIRTISGYNTGLNYPSGIDVR
jgi:hypothetical protein